MFRQRMMLPFDSRQVFFIGRGWLAQRRDARRTGIQFIVNPQSGGKAKHGSEQGRRLARLCRWIALAPRLPGCRRAFAAHSEANHTKQKPKSQPAAEQTGKSDI